MTRKLLSEFIKNQMVFPFDFKLYSGDKYIIGGKMCDLIKDDIGIIIDYQYDLNCKNGLMSLNYTILNNNIYIEF